MRSFPFHGLLVAALAVAPLAPAGATPAEGEALLMKAEAAIREGDATRAVLFLEQAYAADPDPRYIANLGVVYERSGQYAEAAEAFERYLASDPEPSKRAAAESALARLRPEGLIVSRPSGAAVFIDGAPEPAGRTPLRTRLLAGPHTVRLALDGHLPADAALAVEAGQGFQLERALAPEPVDAGGDRRLAGYLLVGGGAAALLAGGGLGWLTADALAERDAAEASNAFLDAQNRANLYGWSGILAGAVGLGAVAAGSYLLVTPADAPAEAGIDAVVVGPGGVGLTGRF